MISTRGLRLAVCSVLVLILAVLALQTAGQGLSDLYVQSARQETALWSAPGRQVRGDEWPRVMGYLDQGVRYAPRSAWALEELGAMHLRRVRVAAEPGLALSSARAGYVNLRRTLAARPSSPFAWANLALAKLFLDEIDAELFAALKSAAELGPWEPEVQQTVFFVGLAAWAGANQRQRGMIVAAMDRAAARDAAKVVRIAMGFDRLDLICDRNLTRAAAGTSCGRVPPKAH